jgi:hypothetical protein
MNRRNFLKISGVVGVSSIFPLCLHLSKGIPLAYIIVEDTDYEGKINRAWHVFWGNNAKKDFDEYKKDFGKYLRNVKELIIYNYADYPERVRKTIELKQHLDATPLTSCSQFHCFCTFY